VTTTGEPRSARALDPAVAAVEIVGERSVRITALAPGVTDVLIVVPECIEWWVLLWKATECSTRVPEVRRVEVRP
jgi:hypothetical protein